MVVMVCFKTCELTIERGESRYVLCHCMGREFQLNLSRM